MELETAVASQNLQEHIECKVRRRSCLLTLRLPQETHRHCEVPPSVSPRANTNHLTGSDGRFGWGPPAQR